MWMGGNEQWKAESMSDNISQVGTQLVQQQLGHERHGPVQTLADLGLVLHGLGRGLHHALVERAGWLMELSTMHRAEDRRAAE